MKRAAAEAAAPLDAVREHAIAADLQKRLLSHSIRDARTAGLPLREIAKAANISYETVRRICQ